MKDKSKKVITQERKEAIANRSKLLERESNITLVSVSVAIVSFLTMLYVQNAVTTNFIVAQSLLTVLEVILSVAAVATAVVAIWKKKYYLFEYTVFTLIMAIGYYLLKNGAAGIPFLYQENENGLIISETGLKLASYLQSNYIIYALWAINVIYCVYAIVFHSIKYTKIKNKKNKEFQGKNI